MAAGITWYDVLGVTAGASSDTLHDAYERRTRQLRPELFSGAPSPVVLAATRARASVEAAWLVLGDASRRQRYDAQIGLHRKRGGGFKDGPPQYGQDPYELLGAIGGLIDGDLPDAAKALVSWMAPLPTPPRRRLLVPDVRGLFYRPCLATLTAAGLRMAAQRVTPDPQPVEGLVVDQSPTAGSQVRYMSTLTVRVWHPPR